MPIRTCRSTLAATLTLLASCGGVEEEEELLLLTPPEQPAAAARGECPRQRKLELDQPVWDLYVSARAWDALHLDVNSTMHVPALLCVDGHPHPLKLELQGASSRKLPKKSFDLKFGAATPLDAAVFGEVESLPRVLLKAMPIDQTLVREALAFAAWRGMGHLAPRIAFVNLRINGSYWGLYNLIEPIDQDFLARHGFPEGGHLYKAVRTKQGRADFRPGRDLLTGFEDKSDQPGDVWPDLQALANRLQRTPLTYEAFMRDIDRVFPLAAYLDRMVWIAVTQNSDAVAQNFYLYNVPDDGHDAWTMLPWDSNVAFGGHWSQPYELLGPEVSPLVDGGSYFGERLLQVPELRAQYLERFRELLDTDLHHDVLHGYLADLEARVRHDLKADQARWQREVPPDEAFQVVRDFVRDRPEVMHAALAALADDSDAGAAQDASATLDATTDQDAHSSHAL